MLDMDTDDEALLIIIICSGGVGLYMVGPLYRVMTDAPATQKMVPTTFATPSFRFSLTCSILYINKSVVLYIHKQKTISNYNINGCLINLPK